MRPLFMRSAHKVIYDVVNFLDEHDRQKEAKALVLGYIIISKNLEKNYYSSSAIHGFIQKLSMCLEELKRYDEATSIFKEFINFNEAFTHRDQLLNYNRPYQTAYTYA